MYYQSRIHLRSRVFAYGSELCCSEALAGYFSVVVAKQTGEKRLQRDISDRLALTCVSVTEKEDTKFRTNSTRVSAQLHPSSLKKENKRATRSH